MSKGVANDQTLYGPVIFNGHPGYIEVITIVAKLGLLKLDLDARKLTSTKK